MTLKQTYRQLLVAADYSQLRTMTSETVDPIGRSLPPPPILYMGLRPERQLQLQMSLLSLPDVTITHLLIMVSFLPLTDVTVAH